MVDEIPYKKDCPGCVIRRFWFDDLKFCGCGSQGEVLGLMRDTMKLLKAPSDNEHDWAEAFNKRNALFAGDYAKQYLVYYVLDLAEVTEHGGSVPGWLTDAGEYLLQMMGDKSEEELDELLNHEPYDHLAEQTK